MTGLDELKQQWGAQDQQLQQVLRLNHALVTSLQLGRTQSAMRPFILGVALHAAAWFAIIVALGNFIFENIAFPASAIPGIALDLYAIFMFAGLLGQLIAASSIDYSQPLTEVQARLEKVRMLRIRTTQWGVFVGFALWAPSLIVILRGVVGIDPYRWLNLRWLVANMWLGLGMTFALFAVSRRFSEAAAASPFLQRLMRDLAGRSLTNAAANLREISAFQTE